MTARTDINVRMLDIATMAVGVANPLVRYRIERELNVRIKERRLPCRASAAVSVREPVQSPYALRSKGERTSRSSGSAPDDNVSLTSVRWARQPSGDYSHGNDIERPARAI